MKRDYDNPVYRKLRYRTLTRDKRCCQMPGCDTKKPLHVHHIRPWSISAHLRFDPDNLITLCKSCHESIKGQEHIYEPLFMGIVRRNANNS